MAAPICQQNILWAATPFHYVLPSKASSGGAIGKKMAIAKLGPKLAPWLAKHGLALQDGLPALELVNSVEELIEAVEDPHTFLDRLVSRLGPVLKATASAPAALVGVEPEPGEVKVAETNPQHHSRSSTALTAKSVFSAVALLAHALTRQMKEFVDMLRQASGTGANPVLSTLFPKTLHMISTTAHCASRMSTSVDTCGSVDFVA